MGETFGRYDAALASLAMALCALFVGYANYVDPHDHFAAGLRLLTVGIVLCAIGVIVHWPGSLHDPARRILILILTAGFLIAVPLNLAEANFGPRATIALITLWLIALCPVAAWPGNVRGLVLAMAIAIFVVVGSIAFHRDKALASMDVMMFQQRAARNLTHGINPYSAKYPNLYARDAPFYAVGAVDAQNNLTNGFPYPPMSLLMVVPAVDLAGDAHWAHLIAMALSALLLGLARPGRLGAVVAAFFLLTPKSLTILAVAWTEPLLVLCFSLTMFCACRWRKGLPYALGLFLSTKQYAILALPLVPLLAERRGESMKILLKAIIVVAVINLPFFLWNPAAFWRSVVVFQFKQPFRPDALSYAALIWRRANGYELPFWVSLAAAAAACIEGWRRGVRSPAGFAAAVTLVMLVFISLSKQAFVNYYYFTIASAWWAVAAAMPVSLEIPSLKTPSAAPAPLA